MQACHSHNKVMLIHNRRRTAHSAGQAMGLLLKTFTRVLNVRLSIFYLLCYIRCLMYHFSVQLSNQCHVKYKDRVRKITVSAYLAVFAEEILEVCGPSLAGQTAHPQIRNRRLLSSCRIRENECWWGHKSFSYIPGRDRWILRGTDEKCSVPLTRNVTRHVIGRSARFWLC